MDSEDKSIATFLSIALTFALLLIFGCIYFATQQDIRNKQAVQQCVSAGKSPVILERDGSLKACS